MPSLTPWRCVPPGQSLSHLAALFCNVCHFVVLRCPCPSDDGGEVMAIAIAVHRFSPLPFRSQLRAGQRPLSAVRSIEGATRFLAVLGASHLHTFGVSFILQTLLSTVG